MKRILQQIWGDGSDKVRVISLLFAAAMAWGVRADVVHVYEQKSVNGQITTLSDKTVDTDTTFVSQKAPKIDGYIFTHWSISTKQSFENRMVWGCAYNNVSFTVYEETRLIANYVAESLDSDGDGMADGYELYWYGNLAQRPSDDTDQDGYTFAQEVQYGMNPHFFDEEVKAGVVRGESAKLLYNPYGYCSYTVKSQPEGELFETATDWVRPGATITVPTCNRLTTTFAYWMKNGVQQRDEFGRAVNSFSFAMPEENVTLVAVCESDADLREQYYWYGTSKSMNSDTDEDGYYLFEEIAMGTSPLFPDEHTKGVVWQESEKLLYNPYCYQPYTVRCEPEGTLFETSTEWVRPGTAVATKKFDHMTTSFAQWLKNGVRQQDEFGRAIPQVSFAMPSNEVEVVAETRTDETEKEQIYWYGTTAISLDSDTDHDGYTFAQELTQGTSPLFSNETVKAGVVWQDGDGGEVNLQIYEQAVGALVGDQYTELFTSPLVGNAATSRTFANGAAIWPVVADVSGDGLWDLIVFSDSTTNVFVNVGSLGNPQFEERTDLAEAARPWCDMNSTAKLTALSLDVAPTAALSATTNGATLLVSDEEGRIWYYSSTAVENYQLPTTSYQLLHKVWGGSYAGFANGLRLAAVDWDDDGDLDCLCGTAEGKLMLLRDPKVGRPTGLVAEAGVDNVKLDWEPNGQSRVRGYRVYKATKVTKGTEGTASASLSSFGSFMSLSQTSLPAYRDTNLAPATYAYKVSALSRFYTAGNSTPTETESVATESVTATVGGPIITIGDPVKMPDGTVQIVVSINNSMNYQAAGTSIAVPYDAANIAYQKTLPSGISEKLVYKTTAADGVATIAIISGEVAPGSGTFFTLVFYGLIDGVLMGDLDCDGDVDEDDLRILIRVSSLSGRKYTDYQLKAGDFNHNGKLDKGDVQSLRELLKNLGTMAGK